MAGSDVTAYDYFIARKRREYGEKFTTADLAPNLIHHFNTNERIEVDVWGNGETILRGRIGVTGGWKPAFLLMRRRSDRGSVWLLDKRAKVLKVVSA